MIQRIVLFQFKPEVPEAEITACVDLLRTLPAQIPQIHRYELAYNRKGRSERYYLALIAWFADEAALRAYEEHPANGAVARQLIPRIGATTIFDSDSPGEP